MTPASVPTPPSASVPVPVRTEDVAARLTLVRGRIEQAGGDPAVVRVLAVTKGFGADAVAAAVGAGLSEVGENYAAELRAKAAGAPAGTRWHFLGRVQRNKVAGLAPVVDVWESVSRAVEGEKIAASAPGATVLVEVETTGAEGRNGCRPSEVAALVRDLSGLNLNVNGLMTVAPAGDREAAGAAFETVRRLADELGLPERSMGMSDDLELAVAAGSTLVRVGRGLFGERPRTPRA